MKTSLGVNNIREWAEKNAPELSEIIGDPITSAARKSVVKSIPSCPDAILDLLSEMDGQKNDLGDAPALIPSGDDPYSLFSSQEIIEQFAARDGMIMDKRKPSNDAEIQSVWFDEGWIEFASDGDTVLVVDRNPTSSGVDGQILQVGYDWPVRRVLWQSLADFFANLCQCYHSDTLIWDAEKQVVRTADDSSFPDLVCPS